MYPWATGMSPQCFDIDNVAKISRDSGPFHSEVEVRVRKLVLGGFFLASRGAVSWSITGERKEEPCICSRISDEHFNLFQSLSSLPVLSLRSKHKLSSPRRTARIPTLPPRKGKTPFRVLPAVLATQHLVHTRCSVPLLEASTLRLALGHWTSTPEIQI